MNETWHTWYNPLWADYHIFLIGVFLVFSTQEGMILYRFTKCFKITQQSVSSHILLLIAKIMRQWPKKITFNIRKLLQWLPPFLVIILPILWLSNCNKYGEKLTHNWLHASTQFTLLFCSIFRYINPVLYVWFWVTVFIRSLYSLSLHIMIIIQYILYLFLNKW